MPVQSAQQPVVIQPEAQPTPSEPAAPVLLPSPTPVTPATFPIGLEREVIFSRDSATNTIKIVSLPVPVLISNEQNVLSLRPRVELFESPSSNVIDQVNLGELATPQFEFMQGIFRLAGLWDVRNTIFSQNDTTSKILEEASVRLTRVLNDRWNQGKELKWIFKHTGTNGDHILGSVPR